LYFAAEVSRLKKVNIVDKMSSFMEENPVQLNLQSVSSKKNAQNILNSVEKSTNKAPGSNTTYTPLSYSYLGK